MKSGSDEKDLIKKCNSKRKELYIMSSLKMFRYKLQKIDIQSTISLYEIDHLITKEDFKV